jgi:glycosyltransferase involved in cell wall biosynthesis
MRNPTVSFIVPCYKLGHFLPECVNSILSQSFRDTEVLIMDDCSPDNTGEVTRSFNDSRVRYMRNDSNLGHLRNYNKGINLSRGTYIWIISADDRLRSNYVLERYVQIMVDYPKVGYVFCPGIELKDGVETRLLGYYYYGSVDKIFKGQQFISTVLFKDGGILSPSVMVRKDCYEQISMFPLDMPHKGDMYLWFLWAIEYDVAYLSEPMVNYRFHDCNMMTDLMSRKPMTVFTDDVNVLWRIKRKADQKELNVLAQQIEFVIAKTYAEMAASVVYNGKRSSCGLGITQCDEALRNNAVDVSEYLRLRGKFYALMAENDLQNGSFENARKRMTSAGEYSSALNVVIEFLRLYNFKQVGPKRTAMLRLSAARIYWCQRRFVMSILTVSHAVLTWPIILGLALKPLRHWFRLACSQRGQMAK